MRDIEDIRIRDSHTSPPSRTRYNCIFEIDLNIDVSSDSFYKFRNPVVAQYDCFSFLYCQICSFFSFKKLYIHECICICIRICMYIHMYAMYAYIVIYVVMYIQNYPIYEMWDQFCSVKKLWVQLISSKTLDGYTILPPHFLFI